MKQKTDDLDMVSGHAPDWKKNLENSKVFMIMGTPAYFTDVLGFDQSYYAKKLGLPFIILLKTGQEIPHGYPTTPNPVVLRWDTNDDLIALRDKLPDIIEKVSKDRT